MISLASSSKIRAAILKQAKIPYDLVSAKIDEESITKTLISEGAKPRDIVDALAEFKARKGATKTDGLVLGCDQLLSFKGQILGKPANKQDLSETLKRLRGQRHDLFVGNVLYKDTSPIWRFVGKVTLTMQDVSDTEIADYIDAHWDTARHCAGGYAIENTPYLFSSVKGDWFDILGLSLDPLRQILTRHGITDTARPVLAGVMGYPISHSKSPTLHGHWLKTLKIPGFYTALESPPAYFEDTVHLLQSAGFAGVNVTLPHKEAALAMAAQPTQAATSIGAANTLVFQENARISGDNTDGIGFWSNIKQALPGLDVSGQKCVVLGAGGAARAVIWALLNENAQQVVLTNRTRSKSEALAKEFGDRIVVADWDDRDICLTDSAFLVNTTALGMKHQPALDISLDNLPKSAVVTDIVYTPLETDLLKAAKLHGCETVDGVGMLLHQAVPGFAAWFGVVPTVDDDLRQAVLG